MKTVSLSFIFFLFLIIGFVDDAHATHTMGVDMTYECLGPGQYRITLQVYRDCNGIAMVNSHQINYSSAQCGVSGSITVHQVGVVDITPVCQQNGNDACNGSGQYGVEKYTFLGILTLPVGCGNDWVLSWELCCRNGAITNLLDPLNETVYIEICLDNTLSPCNSSPFFLNNPIPFYCLNQPVNYNHGVIDVDGDSLAFHATTSLSNGGVSVAYQPGYSGNAPFNTSVGNSYTVDPITGDISYTPDALQIAVAAIRVDEYRNGVHIGCVIRDMQFTIINCNNTLPTATGVNGTDTFNITISTCSDTCFQIFTNDPDAADILTLDWNNGIPSGSFTATAAQHPTGTFCWAPTDLDVGLHYFTVTVSDDHCPLIGTNMYSYIIRVVPSLDPPVYAGRDTVICYGSPITLQATVSGATPTGYSWSDGNNSWNTQSFTVTPAGTASYSVTAFYADGCRKTDNVLVTVSDPLISFASPTVVQCRPGPVYLMASTNAVNPTYFWSPSAGLSCSNCPNPSLTPMVAALYCVSLTDGYNCPGNSTCVEVLVNTLISPSLINTDSVTCFGGNNGVVQLSATGGTPPYQYSIDGITFQSSGSFAGLWPNTYTAVIRDALLCDTTVPFTIFQPPQQLAVSISSLVNENCFGEIAGSATLTATGGTPPYQFSLNGMNFLQSGAFSNLSAGNFTGTVRDANLCMATVLFSISQPAQLTVSPATLMAVNCFGGNDGSAQINATGGTAPYQYSIDGINFQNTGTFNNLMANGYTVMVRDANLCLASVQFTILQPNQLLVSLLSISDATCFGSSDGSVTLSSSGGTVPYQYSINGINFQNTGSFTGLGVNTYIATVHDAHLCPAVIPFTVNQPPSLDLSVINADSATCFNANDGVVQLFSSGGTAPYQYSVDGINFQSSSIFNSLPSGSYNAIVRDVNLCMASATFTIGQPALLTATVISNTGVRCFGASDGNAVISAAGGTPPYRYSIDGVNFSPSGSFSGLSAAGYLVTVHDANLCSASVSFNIPFSPALTVGISNNTNVMCYGGNDGSVLISAGGGTPPYLFSIDSINFQASGAFTSLAANSYTVIVRDANLCSAIGQFSIGQPPQLVASLINSATIRCTGGADGSARLSTLGGTPPYQYSLDGINFQNSGTFNGLSAANYTAIVRDGHACLANLQFTIGQPGVLLITVANSDSVRCFGGNDGLVELGVTGGTPPYQSSMDGVNFQPSSIFGNLSAGNYTAIVEDANNCTATVPFIIYQPAPLVPALAASVDAKCFGGNDGAVRISASGGVPSYVYSLDGLNFQTSGAFSALSASNYTATVRDLNWCTANLPFSIQQPPQMNPTVSNLMQVSCSGGNDGSVTLSVSGGTAPYLYSLDGVYFLSSATFGNLTANVYHASIRDANLCPALLQFIITQPGPLSAQVGSLADAKCNGGNDGSVQLSASGGTAPYQYSIDGINFQTSATLTGLMANSYTATIRDAKGCTSSVAFIIGQPASLNIGVVRTDSVSCFNGNDGTVELTANGGMPLYQYSLDGTNFQSSPVFNPVRAGNYTATVIDRNLCIAAVPLIMLQPSPLNPVITDTADASCFGNSDGSVTLSISGGTGAYSVSLGAMTLTASPYIFSGLPGNTYIIHVTDMNNCSASVSVTIGRPAPFILILNSITAVTCFGGNDGSVVMNCAGGTPSFLYSIDGSLPGLNYTFSGLSAGIHLAEVSDVNQCTASLQINMTQPQQTTFLATAVTDVQCFGESDGAVNLSVTGSAGPWTYVWSTGSVAANISGLTTGFYSVTISDVNRCNSLVDSIFVGQPAQLTVSTAVQNISCFGDNDGIITANISGGTPAYSCTWNNAVTGNPLNALAPGNYSVTVTDSHHCTVIAPAVTVTQAEVLTLSTAVTDVSCPGFSDGSVSAYPSGGTPGYSYQWSNLAGDVAVDANLSAGTYQVTVTDSNLCSVSGSNTITELEGIIITGNVRNVLCNPLENGFVELAVQTLYPPASYIWSNGANTSNIYNLPSGTYSVTVSDANNCEQHTSFAVENDNVFTLMATPPFSTISLGNTVNLLAVGGGGNIASILWEPPNGLSCTACIAPEATPAGSIYYNATAVSDSGCVASDRVYIKVDAEHVIFIPNVFTPDGHGNNDFFEVYGNKESWADFKVMVFDRIGEKMFDSQDKYFKWDGSYKGKPCAPQVFVYVIKVAYIDGYYDKIYKGSITLLR